MMPPEMIPPEKILPEESRHEREIDGLLKALGTRDLPPGMEQRLIRRLAGREESVPARRFRRPHWLWPASLITLATVAVLTLVLTLQHPRGVPPGPGQARIEQPLSSSAVTEIAPGSTGAASVVARASRSAGSVQRRLAPAEAAAPAQPAGFPAPPMPLTDQERLLLRIAHRGDPQQVAALDPLLQDRLNARASAEFKQFFTPPPPPPPLPDPSIAETGVPQPANTVPQPATPGDPR